MKRIKFLITIIAMFIISPTLVYAEEVQETYQGKYTLDYLLRNYNVVTFGQNDNPTYDFISEFPTGNVNVNIEGPVLINGDYYDDDFEDIGIKYSYYNDNDVISYISGATKDYVTTDYRTSTNENFIDFNKLYTQILKESKSLYEKTEYKIKDKNMHIDKPGIYHINSTRVTDDIESYDTAFEVKTISNEYRYPKFVYIDNYDPNNYYIFNNLKTYEFDNYIIFIKYKDDDTFTYMDEFIDSGNYSGNIIFNYPNAKFIHLYTQSGKIVAPKADVVYDYPYSVFSNSSYKDDMSYYIDSVIANSVTALKAKNYSQQTIIFTPYSSTKKIEFKASEIAEVLDVKDFEDDIYDKPYTINEMLGNYSVVTLGQKEYEEGIMLANSETVYQGDVSLFHIAGQFLINGNLSSYRMDLESNKINESYFSAWKDDGRWNVYTWDLRFKSWGDGDEKSGSNSAVFSATIRERKAHIYKTNSTYINFERLYNSIIEEQKKFKLGNEVKETDGIANIKIGNNYYISNINEIDEIVFKNFDENESKLTVITILDEEVYFPVVSQTASGNYVSTKDYLGKEAPMFAYEYTNFPEDIYYGNIIWNLPNAKYIQLAEDSPFFGHIVAPNADLEMPETHFAGGVIVNSVYAAGNSEAHFYPLQPVDIPEDYDCVVANTNYYNGKWYTDTTVLAVNPTAKDQINTTPDEITNPPTAISYKDILGLSISLIIGILTIVFIERKTTSV